MRTRGQVLAAAAQTDRATAAGLPAGSLVVLAVARSRVAGNRGVEDLQPGLRAAAAHPAARIFDELLAGRICRRSHLR